MYEYSTRENTAEYISIGRVADNLSSIDHDVDACAYALENLVEFCVFIFKVRKLSTQSFINWIAENNLPFVNAYIHKIGNILKHVYIKYLEPAQLLCL